SLKGSFHLVLDGWTVPTAASYLGLVVVWHENGEIFCFGIHSVSIIYLFKKFILIWYLAEVVANCLRCFGISNSVCISYFCII
ncbi:hypothetical protein P691DRAFT_689171, partial [Macrolepiota fuliginosa MF-IS2]